MFRFEENVPEIYVNESRDFQLLCRLADAVYGGVKYEVDSLRHTANTKEINSNLLPLLKSKVGFFSEDNLTEDQLRYLLQGFPAMMRNKGSKKAIKEALYLWFRLHKVNAKIVRLDIDNETKQINLDVAMIPKDLNLIDELFTYILPTGYLINYHFGAVIDADLKLEYTDRIKGIIVDDYNNSRVRNNINQNQAIGNTDADLKARLMNKVGMTRVAANSVAIEDIPDIINGQNIEIINTGELPNASN